MYMNLLPNLAEILPTLDAETLHDLSSSLTENQQRSKQWLLTHVAWFSEESHPIVMILGGWYGSYIVPMCIKELHPSKIIFVDKDPKVIDLAKRLHRYHTATQFDYICCNIETNINRINSIYADIVLNTSCEHMFDMINVENMNPDCLYAFQSCDNKDDPGHINTVSSTKELMNQSGLTEQFYDGWIPLNHKNRYMVIGTKRIINS